MSEVRRGDLYLVMLNPTRGDEIRNMRPCLVVSPDELNSSLNTFIVAPMTTGGHEYPFRLSCEFGGMAGFTVLDQLRTVDRRRMARRLGRIEPDTLRSALQALGTMFEH